MKKSIHAKGTQFSIEVCDAIRHHLGEIKSLESKRENAFKDRNAALAAKRELHNKDSKEYADESKRHSDAVILIDSLDDEIKWHTSQVKATTLKADDPQLEIKYAPPPPKEAEDPKQMKMGDTPKDTRPVGRARAKEVEPAVPVGENQHLLARVIELDMREDLKGACIDATLGTVGAVYEIVKTDDDEATKLAEKLNLDGSAARQVRAAVELYLKKHTKAEMAVERGGTEPVQDNRAKHGKGAGKAKRR